MSSLIEGVGDEVLLVFGLLFLVLLLSLAWISTHVGDAPPISIIILDRRRWNVLLQHLRNTSATIIRIPVAQHIRQHLTSSAPQPDTPVEPAEQQPEALSGAPATEDTDTVTSQPSSSIQSNEPDITPKSDSPQASLPQTSDDNQTTQTTSSDQSSAAETEDQPTEEEWQEKSSEGYIRVRVKYLDDRQRLLYAKPDTTIGQLKREHFRQELSDNMAVRIVYQGQELRAEGATLQGCNITDNSVIHIVLTRVQQATEPTQSPGRPQQFDPGNLMMPLFAVILGLVWYCRFVYRAYFSVLATICLVGITFLFSLVTYATLRVQRVRGREHID